MWLPIETAPKDEVILGWDQRVMRGQGMARVVLWALNLTTNEKCWMSMETAIPVEVTHWLPIPASPKSPRVD